MSIRTDTLSLVTDDETSPPATPEDESIAVIDPNEKAPVLSIELSKDETPIGEQLPVEIKIVDVSQLFGVSFELQFDPV